MHKFRHGARGGSWDDDPVGIRSAARGRGYTGGRCCDHGFRVMKVPGERGGGGYRPDAGPVLFRVQCGGSWLNFLRWRVHE